MFCIKISLWFLGLLLELERVKIKNFRFVIRNDSFPWLFRLLFTNIDGFNACKTCVYIARLMVLSFYFIKLS